MRTQTLLIVLLALTFGGIAAGGVMLLSNGDSAKGDERAAMLIAAVDVPRGETLVAESFVVQEFPKGAVLPGAVTRIEDAAGRSALTTLFKGEPIMEVKLAPKGAGRGLASLIKKGMRAISIPTPNVGAGVAGFIVPGSRVDVHWHSQDASGQEGRSDAPLLENVEVLAVDDKIDVPAANRTEGSQMKSVTVQVRPDEAGKLTPALSKGTIHLSLRNPGDDSRIPPRPVAPPPPPAPKQVKEHPAAPSPRYIRMIRGIHESVIRIDGQAGSSTPAK